MAHSAVVKMQVHALLELTSVCFPVSHPAAVIVRGWDLHSVDDVLQASLQVPSKCKP
jgi:hypothetical protein